MRQDIINTGLETSDTLHVEDIVWSAIGDFKFSPSVGFCAQKYVKSNVTRSRFFRNLKVQLSYDGYHNSKVDLSQGISSLKIEIQDND